MASINRLWATVLCVWIVAVGGWSSIATVTAAESPNCAPTLLTLQGCLQFVTGKSAAPTEPCCSAVLEVHQTKPVCLCVLAMDDNTTRIIPDYRLDLAGQLPTLCKIQGASIANCPALLGGTNGTAPAAAPGAPAPAASPLPGAAFRLTTSANLREFILTYLSVALVASALINYVKY